MILWLTIVLSLFYVLKRIRSKSKRLPLLINKELIAHQYSVLAYTGIYTSLDLIFGPTCNYFCFNVIYIYILSDRTTFIKTFFLIFHIFWAIRSILNKTSCILLLISIIIVIINLYLIRTMDIIWNRSIRNFS